MGHQQVRFAVQHLLGAASFSRRAGELERAHASEAYGPFFDEILHAASACVFMAAASLEALSNELLEDVGVAPDLPPGKLFDEERLLDRFDALLVAGGAAKLNRGGSPVQEVGALLALRNALVHFKPAPIDDQSPHERVSQRVGDKLRTPFLSPSETLFPRAWASHARTRWALEHVRAFEALVTQRLGLASRMAKHAARLDA